MLNFPELSICTSLKWEKQQAFMGSVAVQIKQSAEVESKGFGNTHEFRMEPSLFCGFLCKISM